MRTTFQVARRFGNELAGYISQIDGSLFVATYEDDGEEDEEEEVGRITASLIHVEDAFRDGVHPADVANSVDQNMWDAWDAVKRKNGCFKVFAADPLSENMLHAKSMEILPEYRGNRFGFLLLDSLLATFAKSCGVVVVEPHPLKQHPGMLHVGTEWHEKMRWPELASNQAEYAKGAARLKSHWAQLGFHPVPGTRKRFYFRNTDTFYPFIRVTDSGDIQLVAK